MSWASCQRRGPTHQRTDTSCSLDNPLQRPASISSNVVSLLRCTLLASLLVVSRRSWTPDCGLSWVTSSEIDLTPNHAVPMQPSATDAGFHGCSLAAIHLGRGQAARGSDRNPLSPTPASTSPLPNNGPLSAQSVYRRSSSTTSMSHHAAAPHESNTFTKNMRSPVRMPSPLPCHEDHEAMGRTKSLLCWILEGPLFYNIRFGSGMPADLGSMPSTHKPSKPRSLEVFQVALIMLRRGTCLTT